MASGGKQWQAVASGGKRRQVAASSGKRWQAAASGGKAAQQRTRHIARCPAKVAPQLAASAGPAVITSPCLARSFDGGGAGR